MDKVLPVPILPDINKPFLLSLSLWFPEKYWYNKYSITYNGEDKKVEATLNLNGHRQAKEVYNLKFKSNTLLCDGNGGNLIKKVWQNGKARKLMPIEYERLQTLPDNYTEGLSDSRRYSAIGNGWTVDVITHILKEFALHENLAVKEDRKVTE